MIVLLLSLGEMEGWYTIGVVSAGVILYVITKVVRTSNQKRQDTQEQFNQTVEQLSKDNETAQLSAAIILRRFFNAVIDKDRFREETINVISSMLKIHPTGIYQKTLGDGLAYANNLNYADLMRTNMQDLYVGKKNEKDDALEKEGINPNPDDRASWRFFTQSFRKKHRDNDDSWKITMDFTDMFGANLSYALVENVVGFGTVFNSAVLHHTNIKNCSFKRADFKYADLTNVYFENVVLEGSNFKGATGIPSEMSNHLEWVNKGTKDEAYVYKDANPFTLDKTKKRGGGHKRVFFSMPGTLSASEEALILFYKKILEDKGMDVKYYKRDHYPKDGQLTKVKYAIAQSDAMIAFGFKQIEINTGHTRHGKKKVVDVRDSWLPTPWNEIEVGMGSMANLPILLVRDEEVEIGVFDKVISEYKIKSLTSAIPLADIEKNEEFKKWLSLFQDSESEMELKEDVSNLAECLAEQKHNVWVQERIDQGWTYGEKRDDAKKQHPCWVAYEDLPEEEKVYDRNTSVETLKLILKLGFTIKRK